MNANVDGDAVAEPGFGDLSQRVIGCALAVSNELGAGFLESVYENALCVELRAQAISFERQKPLTVRYRAVEVGHFFADLVVAGQLLVEIKAVRQIVPEHESQVMNYLRATGMRVGLLLNFGSPRLGIRRLVLGYRDDRSI